MDSDDIPPPPPEEDAAPPPPLPPSSPPPPPPPPPPSMQTSNQISDMLDFDSDVGGQNTHSSKVGEAAKTGTILHDPETVANDGERHVVNDCGQHKRKASDPVAGSSNRRKSKCLHSEKTGTQTQGSSQDETNCIMSGDSGAEMVQVNNLETQESENVTDPEAHGSPLNKQEFEIIDDIGSEEEEGYDFDSELDEDEIDALLDEGLQNYRHPYGSNDEDEFAAPIEREKIVLKEHNEDPFDILPEGWVAVTHNSGMPVYLHKQSRVCSVSRPYFLGPGSARKHDIPLSAVTCLQYRREQEKNKKEAQGIKEEVLENGTKENGTQEPGTEGTESGEAGSSDGTPQNITNGEKESTGVRVECLEKYNRDKMLGPLELRTYCERLFEFQTITVKKYRTWKDRRKHHKLLKINTRPSLPSNTKLITCPILINKQEDKPNKKKEFVLNPAGKSHICILHEYVQHALRVQPRYIIKELENAQTPYSATVIINNVEYGAGYASSKKSAKNEAAKVTLGILIPELKKVTDKSQDIHDLSFFDEVKIEDPRVHDLCHKAGQPGPFQILCECLRRNFGMGDTNCQMDMKTLKHQKSEFTMRVGKHNATVICKNKRDGKQLAAQAILQKLHPHIHNWGSLLRLYGTDWKAIKEKKEELSVTSLHGQSAQHMPNTVILNKLKEEMTKLQMRRDSPLLMALDLAAQWRPFISLPSDLLRFLNHPSFGEICAMRYSTQLIEYLRDNQKGTHKALWGWEKLENCLCCARPRRLVTNEEKPMQTTNASVPTSSQSTQTEALKCETQGMQTNPPPKGVSMGTSTEKVKDAFMSLPANSCVGFLPRVLHKASEKSHKNQNDSAGDSQIGKIFVEMSSQTENLLEYPELQLLAVKEEPTISIATAQLAYGQTIATVAPLVSSINPYLLGCQTLLYPTTQSSAVTPLPLEYRVARKTYTDTSSTSGRSTPPASPTGSTRSMSPPPVEKSSLPSYKAYWRATPKSYTPQESLLSAGTVPPEQRCWKRQPQVLPLPTSNREVPRSRSPPTRSTSGSARNGSPPPRRPPSPIHRSSRSSDIKPLMMSGNYPNPYMEQNMNGSHRSEQTRSDLCRRSEQTGHRSPDPWLQRPPPLLLPGQEPVRPDMNQTSDSQQRHHQNHTKQPPPPQQNHTKQPPPPQQNHTKQPPPPHQNHTKQPPPPPHQNQNHTKQPPPPPHQPQHQVQQQAPNQSQQQSYNQAQAAPQQAMAYTAAIAGANLAMPTYPGMAGDPSAYYQQPYMYGQAPYGYAYSAYAPTWNWQ